MQWLNDNKKRFLALLLLLSGIFGIASASLVDPTVYHGPSRSRAPFMEVHQATVNPLDPEKETLQVSFIDIGVGDAILITSGGQTMLVDGGTASRFARLEGFLKQEGITSLDYLFVTHAHDDHIQGATRLMEAGYQVGQLLTMHAREYRNPEHLKMVAVADNQQIPIKQVVAGDVMTLGTAELTFFNNPDRPSNRSINAISMMLHLRFGSATMLLPSDASGDSLDIVARDFPELMKVDIMKSPHHGLNRLTVPFLNATQAQLVVITSNMEGGTTLAKQLIRNQIPHYYISMGTVRTQTDGENWYVFQDEDQ